MPSPEARRPERPRVQLPSPEEGRRRELDRYVADVLRSLDANHMPDDRSLRYAIADAIEQPLRGVTPQVREQWTKDITLEVRKRFADKVAQGK